MSAADIERRLEVHFAAAIEALDSRAEAIVNEIPCGLSVRDSRRLARVAIRQASAVPPLAWRMISRRVMPHAVPQAILQAAKERAAIDSIASEIDPAAPDTFGWRVFRWTNGELRSPIRGTIWPADGILTAERWSDGDALRGAAGIHARRLPRDWRVADPRLDEELGGYTKLGIIIALVERWGRAVIGSHGWRAEHVAIRAVRAPSTDIGLAIEAAYPTVEVIYEDR